MRNRKKTWTKDELENNNYIIKNAKDFKGKWHNYFNNNNPIYLEIGCGKGNFINKLSKLNKNINFIAFEKESQIIAIAAKKLREINENKNIIENLIFILEDAINLENYFVNKELNRIYINFCDPWPNKNKWIKKRLTNKIFLNKYKNLLDKDGEIHFKTDNKQLFEFSLNEFCKEDWNLKNITLDLNNSKFQKNIITEYEEKFVSRGMNIYRLEAYKKFI